MTSDSDVVNSSEDEEQFESIIAHRERRSNAGARMRRLIDMEKAGEAELEMEMEDDDKDVDLLFQEDENDEEFTGSSEEGSIGGSEGEENGEQREESESERDSEDKDLDENFSSDTELSSSESESDESAGERELQAEEKLKKKQKRKRALEIPQIKPLEPSRKKPKVKKSNIAPPAVPRRRKYSTRKSTVKKTEAVMKRWKESQEKKKHMKPVHKEVYVPKTLKERLEEAKITEKENTLSLNQYFEREEARKRRQKELAESRKPKIKQFIRFYSSAVYVTPNEEVENIEKERLRQEKIEEERNKRKRSGRRKRRKTPTVDSAEKDSNKDTSQNVVKIPSNGDQKDATQGEINSVGSNVNHNSKLTEASTENSKHEGNQSVSNNDIISAAFNSSGNANKVADIKPTPSVKQDKDSKVETEITEKVNKSILKENDVDAKETKTDDDTRNPDSDQTEITNTGTGISNSKENIQSKLDSIPEIESEVTINDKQKDNSDDKQKTVLDDKVESKADVNLVDKTDAKLKNNHEGQKDTLNTSGDNNETPKLIYEGPSQYVAVNYVSFEKFSRKLTEKDIKTALFGKQSTLPAERRDPHFTNICTIRQDNSTDLSIKRLKEDREASLKSILKLPRFGEKYKVIEEKKEEKQKEKVEANITTPAPVGIYLPNGKKKECPISGESATYYDPGSGVPYSSVECFKILQKVTAGEYYWGQIDDGGVNSQFKGGIGCYMGEVSGRHAKGVPEGF